MISQIRVGFFPNDINRFAYEALARRYSAIFQSHALQPRCRYPDDIKKVRAAAKDQEYDWVHITNPSKIPERPTLEPHGFCYAPAWPS
jgi:hypothetical protein